MRLIGRAKSFGSRVTAVPVELLSHLEGSLVALVTPLRAGKLDAVGIGSLCERQRRRGTSALVICGSTGEGSSLSGPEQALVVSIAVEAAAGQVPVVAGCGALSTEASAALAVSAAENGAGAILCSPPPYSKPMQEGIAAHVRAVAHAAELPVILYDVPARTGVSVADETVACLYESGAIVGIKDAAGDLSRPARLRSLCGNGLIQFAGDDATAPAHRAMGGHGCISVTANLTPTLCARMHWAWRDADTAEFGRIRDLLSPLHDALFSETNPIPVKAALASIGLCEGELRLPLTRASQATVDRLLPILPKLMAAEDEAAGRTRFSLVT